MAVQKSIIAVRKNSREAREWQELETEIQHRARKIYHQLGLSETMSWASKR